MTTLMDLPLELHEMILNLLPPSTMVIMAIVSKYFRLIIFKGQMGPSFDQMEKLNDTLASQKKLNLTNLVTFMYLTWTFRMGIFMRPNFNCHYVYRAFSIVRNKKSVQEYFRVHAHRPEIQYLAEAYNDFLMMKIRQGFPPHKRDIQISQAITHYIIRMNKQ
jgi:hypothetical protein